MTCLLSLNYIKNLSMLKFKSFYGIPKFKGLLCIIKRFLSHWITVTAVWHHHSYIDTLRKVAWLPDNVFMNAIPWYSLHLYNIFSLSCLSSFMSKPLLVCWSKIPEPLIASSMFSFCWKSSFGSLLVWHLCMFSLRCFYCVNNVRLYAQTCHVVKERGVNRDNVSPLSSPFFLSLQYSL